MKTSRYRRSYSSLGRDFEIVLVPRLTRGRLKREFYLTRAAAAAIIIRVDSNTNRNLLRDFTKFREYFQFMFL